MKTVCCISFFLLLSGWHLYAQSDPRLAHTIDSLAAEGQQWREELRQADKLQLNTATRKSLLKKAANADSLCYPAVKKIFQQHGSPGFDLVGRKSSHNFWLLLQRQDRHPAFRDSVLVNMKEQVDKKNASPSDYAILTDKVKIMAGLPQIYGTQLQVNHDSTSYEPKPVIEPEHLNERRKSVGLSSIEEYIEGMNAGRFEGKKKK